jgi:hypothetical protein
LADTNWHIVEDGDRDTRVMLDPHDTSAPYFNIHYMDMAGDNTYVEFVHDNGGPEAERVEIDRIWEGGVGPVGDHGKAIRQEIKKRGLPDLDVKLPGGLGESDTGSAARSASTIGLTTRVMGIIVLFIALGIASTVGIRVIPKFFTGKMQEAREAELIDQREARVIDEWKRNRHDVKREVDEFVLSTNKRLPVDIRGFYTLVRVQTNSSGLFRNFGWPIIEYDFQINQKAYRENFNKGDNDKNLKVFRQQITATFCKEKAFRFGDKYEVPEVYTLYMADGKKTGLSSIWIWLTTGPYKSFCLDW